MGANRTHLEDAHVVPLKLTGKLPTGVTLKLSSMSTTVCPTYHWSLNIASHYASQKHEKNTELLKRSPLPPAVSPKHALQTRLIIVPAGKGEIFTGVHLNYQKQGNE